MSTHLFQQLESKIEHTLETIELLRNELETAQELNRTLQADNTALKQRQIQWESNLASLLRKLENAELQTMDTDFSQES